MSLKPRTLPHVLASVGVGVMIGLPASIPGQVPSASRLKKILVLDKSQGGANGHLESRRDLNKALNELAGLHGFQVDYIGQNDSYATLTQRFAPASLAGYQAVLFSNNDGVDAQVLDTEMGYLQNYVEAGGTLIAMHAASAFISKWPWLTASLVQMFYGPHGSNQPKADMAHDPEGLSEGSETRGIFKGLTAPKGFMDSYYSFRSSPRNTVGVTILLTVDEKTFNKVVNGPMGADHPVVWVKTVGKGKVISNSLGHSWSTNNAYAQNNEYLKYFVYGTLRYAAGDFLGCTDARYLEYNPDATQNQPAACVTLNPIAVRIHGAPASRSDARVQFGSGPSPIRIDIRESGSFTVDLQEANGQTHRMRQGHGPASLQLESPTQPGIYFLRIQAGQRLEIRRLTLLR